MGAGSHRIGPAPAAETRFLPHSPDEGWIRPGQFSRMCMAEPIELKIGQVWVGSQRFKRNYTIVALGPEWVTYTGGCREFVTVPVSHFHRDKGDLLRPKHELWVNVYRNVRGAYIIGGTQKASRCGADDGARKDDGTYDPTRVACLKIEFEEGDGL